MVGQGQGDPVQIFDATVCDKNKAENVEMNYSKHTRSISPSSLNASIRTACLFQHFPILFLLRAVFFSAAGMMIGQVFLPKA